MSGKGKNKQDSGVSSDGKSLTNREVSNDSDVPSSDSQFDEGEHTEEEVATFQETDDTKVEVKSNTTKKDVSPKKQSEQTSTGDWFTLRNIGIGVFIGTILLYFSQSYSDSDSQKEDWRSKIDPENRLSDDQQFIITASLKSIMDQTHREGVSTLLILSPNEKSAGRIAQCLLNFVNRKSRETKVSTEIDLKSHRGGKLRLDQDLQQLFKPGSDIQGVLLRHIDDNSSSDAFQRARLLFAYCDGENPVVPHRLIIMTASSEASHESELRDRFKEYWPTEHDFVDALMSRISGHTLFVDEDQQSIC